MGCLPLTLQAGEQAGEPVNDIKTADVTTDKTMLREIAHVDGYQALTVAGQKIDAAYLDETLGERYGAVILLHDQSEKFDSYGVITTLRHQLPQNGWATLSLDLQYPYTANIYLATEQPPSDASVASASKVEVKQKTKTDDTSKAGEKTTENKAKLPPVSNQQRLEAAVKFLQAKAIKPIIFLGHGKGGSVAIKALDTMTTPVSALILIETSALEPPIENILNTFKQPILDVVGENDTDDVLAVRHRKTLMKRAGNSRYTYRKISGADYGFSGLEPTLTAITNGWLRKNFIEQGDN